MEVSKVWMFPIWKVPLYYSFKIKITLQEDLIPTYSGTNITRLLLSCDSIKTMYTQIASQRRVTGNGRPSAMVLRKWTRRTKKFPSDTCFDFCWVEASTMERTEDSLRRSFEYSADANSTSRYSLETTTAFLMDLVCYPHYFSVFVFPHYHEDCLRSKHNLHTFLLWPTLQPLCYDFILINPRSA